MLITKPPSRGELIVISIFLFIVFPVFTYQWWKGGDGETPTAAYSAPAPTPASRISDADLQTLIADVYHVETSRFITSDLLHITLPPGSNVQKTCQAIANLWAHRSGKNFVRVESWRGNQRIGQGTVQFGQMRTP